MYKTAQYFCCLFRHCAPNTVRYNVLHKNISHQGLSKISRCSYAFQKYAAIYLAIVTLTSHRPLYRTPHRTTGAWMTL
jgi:hypothetical protein